MADITQINKINKVIEEFFKNNSEVNYIAAKELMPALIQAGVFATNHRDGLPLRELLRELDREKRLNLIPSLHPERKTKNTYWYFFRPGVERILF
jgi:hypothetical protein